jgi:hypothetical protein
MLFIQVARPPGDLRRSSREIDHMLAGAAAGLHDVTGFPGQKNFQYRPDRSMISVKCRRVETAVGFDRPAIPAELLDIFSHGILLDWWRQSLPALRGGVPNPPEAERIDGARRVNIHRIRLRIPATQYARVV